MNIKFSVRLLVAIALAFCCLPSRGKVNVELDEYKLVEVTNDGVNIRSGAGTNFPKAYTYYDDWNGKRTKAEVSQAYKGQRFFVKDAGDWWEINTPETVINGDSPRFILKKYATLLETEPFVIDPQSEPQVWGFAETEQYEDDEYEHVTILTIYPEGLAITQEYGMEGDEVRIGGLLNDNSAILNNMAPWLALSGNEVSANAPLKIWAEPGVNPPSLIWEYGEKCRSSFNFNGKKIEFVDISSVPLSQWLAMGQSLIGSPDYSNIRLFRSNPDAYILRSDLSKFVRIK